MTIVILKHELLFLSILKPIKAAFYKAAFIGFIFGGRSAAQAGPSGTPAPTKWFVGQGPCALPGACRSSRGGVRAPRPTEAEHEVHRIGFYAPA